MPPVLPEIISSSSGSIACITNNDLLTSHFTYSYMSLTVIAVTVTLDHKSRHSNLPRAHGSILRDEYQGLLGITLPQTSTAPAGKPSQGKLFLVAIISIIVAGCCREGRCQDRWLFKFLRYCWLFLFFRGDLVGRHLLQTNHPAELLSAKKCIVHHSSILLLF